MFSVVIISITLFLPLTGVFVGMVPASDATDFLLGWLLNSTLTILKINKPVLALIRDYGVIGEFVFFDFFALFNTLTSVNNILIVLPWILFLGLLLLLFLIRFIKPIKN
jgi:hypothetical protein